MEVIARRKQFHGSIAILSGVVACCCMLQMAAGCGQLTCDFDEMGRAAADPGSPQVNPENYERIGKGMTYEEVAAIFGHPGYLTMEHTYAGHTTKIYDWVGVDDFNVSVSFKDGLVARKSWRVPERPESEEPDKTSPRGKPEVVERDEPSGTPGVTLANFEKIKNGMTYHDVVATLGCEGEPKRSHWIGKTEIKEYEWRDARGGYATVGFVRGRACRKYQRGMR